MLKHDEGLEVFPDYPAGKQTKACSSGQPSDMVKEIEKRLDGEAEGEVRSESGQKGPFHQREGCFDSVRWCVTPNGDLFGVSRGIPALLAGTKTVKMARPPHNSSSNLCPAHREREYPLSPPGSQRCYALTSIPDSA